MKIDIASILQSHKAELESEVERLSVYVDQLNETKQSLEQIELLIETCEGSKQKCLPPATKTKKDIDVSDLIALKRGYAEKFKVTNSKGNTDGLGS